jgi:TRAP-type C4-dicarboxylate transport system permease small subunit
MAVVSIIMGIGGIFHVQSHRDESGRGQALAGIIVSLVTLAISVLLVVMLFDRFYQNFHEQITTEQTSNDSE